MAERRFYVVSGTAKHGTVTYKCPTVESAWDTLCRFRGEGRWNIRILDPNGVRLTEAELEALADGSGPTRAFVPEAQA